MSQFNAVIAEVGTGPNFTDFPTNQDLNRKVIYSGPDGLYDAVPVPMMQPADVVRYLRGHFPNLIHLFSDPENLDPVVPEPYTSSALLAEEVLRRRDDPSLFESFYSVTNEMALSREYWMQETLGDLVGGLVHDKAFVARLRPHLNAQANEELEAAMG